MKKFLIIFLVFVVYLFGEVKFEWADKFFGQIVQMKLADINGDGQNEIVAGCKEGIFAIKRDGTILWSHQEIHGADTVISFQYDSDSKPEFAVAGWLSTYIFDDNGSTIFTNSMKSFATSKLPLAILGNKPVSFMDDYYTKGLVFIDNYGTPFYNVANIPSLGLSSYDSDNDGINDKLLEVNQTAILNCFETNGSLYWSKEFNATKYGGFDIVWSGYKDDGNIIIIVGTLNGYLLALDQNGDYLWESKIDGISKIKKDKTGGGFLVVSKQMWGFDVEQSAIYKISDNDGSVLWHYSLATDSKALASSNSKIGVGFGPKIVIFDENGTILQENNISTIGYDPYFYVNSIAIGRFGNDNGVYLGSLDISRFNDDNSTTKIFSGGTLVQKLFALDMNGDGIDEIAAQDENRIYLYDSEGKNIWIKDKGVLFGHADINGDGKEELLAGFDGNITVLDYNGNTLWSQKAYYSNIYPRIVLYDYDKDGLKDVILSSLDYDTQKYFLKVLSGKTGDVLHEFGSLDNCSYINIIDNKLFYGEYGSISWTDLNDTISDAKYTDAYIENGIIADRDFTGDGMKDILSWGKDDDGLKIKVYDMSKILSNESSIVKSLQLDINNTTSVKLFDYNGDGDPEALVVAKGVVALYDKDGSQIWKKEIKDKWGDPRPLYSVQIINNTIYVSGKEIYILDSDGTLLQTIKMPNYMSSEGYGLPFTFANTDSSKELVVGAMGLYGYSGISTDNSSIPKITYKTGWNLIATPVNKTVSLTQIEGLKIAWEYQNGKWLVHTTNDQDHFKAEDKNITEFDAIVPVHGVWIKTTTSGSIAVEGNENSMPILSQGWQLIGGVKTTSDKIHQNDPNVDVIWQYKDGQWYGKSYIDGIALDTLDEISPNSGFWVHVK